MVTQGYQTVPHNHLLMRYISVQNEVTLYVRARARAHTHTPK